MSLERQLRDHLDTAAGRLPDPGDSLPDVSRRGRRRRALEVAAITLSVLVLIAAVPVVWNTLENRTVEFDPVEPAPPTPTPDPEPDPSPAPTPDPTPDPDPDPTPEPDPDRDPDQDPDPEPGADDVAIGEAIAAQELRAPVLAFGHDRGVAIVEDDTEGVLWPDPVDAAMPDGQGGIVLLQSSEPAISWVASGEPAPGVTLVAGDGEMALRGIMPDGRVLYSVRPTDETLTEDGTEDFFAVELAEGAEPELMASTGAYESWTVGPAFAPDGEPVHAGCHLRCSLWPGLAEAPEGADALYHGGGDDAGPSRAIEGLTATPDGVVLAFVEIDLAPPGPDESAPPELVLVAGTSFNELGRIPLPLEPGEEIGTPVVSLSGDGQRVLVTLGSETPPPDPSPPTVPYLVEDAITDDPRIHPVDVDGALRWAEPSAAAGQGGPTTAQERDAAERLMAFAHDPDPATFAEVPLAAEVGLGLGPDLVGAPRPADELADPNAWELDPDGGFRAYAGPFSVIDLLAGADTDEVAITGGPHRHCATPPMPVPDDVTGMRQISIQTSGEDGCLQWFTVDLFLDDQGAIAAVTLDLWEP